MKGGKVNSTCRWAVVLAGGDGLRLRPFTRSLSGDERPKQFCPMIQGRTLLAATRVRIAQLVPPERTLLVLTRTHERFYQAETGGVPANRMIVQPSNRGTLPAIYWTLRQLERRGPQAVAAVLPSDHHYAAEDRFLAAIRAAYRTARTAPEAIVILGTIARTPESGFGWIEPGEEVATSGRFAVSRVRRFWEKPSESTARTLLKNGCLWNTFVMVGRVATFLHAMQTSAPEVCAVLDAVNEQEVNPIVNSLDLAYSRLKSADFAKQVLSANTERLFVLNLGNVGWSDLGEPSRVEAALGLANATRKPVTSAAQVGAVELWGNARSKADGKS